MIVKHDRMNRIHAVRDIHRDAVDFAQFLARKHGREVYVGRASQVLASRKGAVLVCFPSGRVERVA